MERVLHLIFDKNTGTLWIIDSKQIARAKTLEAGAIKLSETGAGGFMSIVKIKKNCQKMKKQDILYRLLLQEKIVIYAVFEDNIW